MYTRIILFKLVPYDFILLKKTRTLKVCASSEVLNYRLGVLSSFIKTLFKDLQKLALNNKA